MKKYLLILLAAAALILLYLFVIPKTKYREIKFTSISGNIVSWSLRDEDISRRFTKETLREHWNKLYNNKLIAHINTDNLKSELDSIFRSDTMVFSAKDTERKMYLTLVSDGQGRIAYSYTLSFYYDTNLDLYLPGIMQAAKWESGDYFGLYVSSPADDVIPPGSFRKYFGCYSKYPYLSASFRWHTKNNSIFSLTNNSAKGAQVVNLDMTINNNIIDSLTISEVNVNMYMPDIDDSWSYENFRDGGIHSGIIGGYEALNEKLVYPAEAKSNNISGRVTVEVLVDEQGNPKGTILRRGIGHGCDEAAMRAIRQVKFSTDPQGKKFSTNVNVDFELEYKQNKFDLTCLSAVYTGSRQRNIICVIKNTGTEALQQNSAEVALYVDGNMVDEATLIKPLGRNEERRVLLTWAPVIGKHEFAVFIDPENRLKEANRGNNIYTGSFEIK